MKSAFRFSAGISVGLLLFILSGGPASDLVANRVLLTPQGDISPMFFKSLSLPVVFSIIQYYLLPAILAGYLAHAISRANFWSINLSLLGLIICYAIIDILYISRREIPQLGMTQYRFCLGFQQTLLCSATFLGITIGGFLYYSLEKETIRKNFLFFIILLLFENFLKGIQDILFSPWGVMPFPKEVYVLSPQSKFLEYLVTYIPYALVGVVAVFLSKRYGVLLAFWASIAYSWGLFGLPSFLFTNITSQFLYSLSVCLATTISAFITLILKGEKSVEGKKKPPTLLRISFGLALLFAFLLSFLFIVSGPRIKVTNWETFVLPLDAPLIDGKLVWGIISPQGGQLALAYSEGGGGRRQQIRLLSKGKAPLDLPILPAMDISKSWGEWSPDGRWILLRDVFVDRVKPIEGVEAYGVCLIDTNSSAFHLISENSCPQVYIYSAWCKSSDAFLLAEYSRKSEFPSLFVSDLRGRKRKIFEYQFLERYGISEPFFAGAMWDKEGDYIYIWEEGKGVFRAKYPDLKVDKLYDFPRLSEDYSFALLLNPSEGILLLGKQEIPLGEDICKSYLSLFDLINRRYIYKERFTESLTYLMTSFYSFSALRATPSGRGFLFLNRFTPLPVKIFCLNSKKEISSFSLQICSGELIDAIWGKEEGVVYISVLNFDMIPTNQTVIKLYKVKLQVRTCVNSNPLSTTTRTRWFK